MKTRPLALILCCVAGTLLVDLATAAQETESTIGETAASAEPTSADYEELEDVERKELDPVREEKHSGQHKKGEQHHNQMKGKDKQQHTISGAKPFDPSKVKLVDLSQWNGAVAKNSTTTTKSLPSSTTTSTSTTTTDPSTELTTTTSEPTTVAKPPTSRATRKPTRKGPRKSRRPTTKSSSTTSTSTTSPARPSSTGSTGTLSVTTTGSTSDSSMTLPTIEVRQPTEGLDAGGSTSGDKSDPNLDPRSPVSAAGKRLSGIIADSKHKLLHRPNPSSPSKFLYSRPNSTTTMMSMAVTESTTPMSSTSGPNMFVQVINTTTPSDLMGFSQFENATKNLDWSKLVKVVFKSAKDNHTIYTVVMNSSELNNHPINDWSNELPHLLQRDFEKLVQKWSSVFPVDNLMVDLSKIIVNKVTALPNSLNVSSLLDKLNATSSGPVNSSLVQANQAAKLKSLAQSGTAENVTPAPTVLSVSSSTTTPPPAVNISAPIKPPGANPPVDAAANNITAVNPAPITTNEPTAAVQPQPASSVSNTTGSTLPPATSFSKTYDLNNTLTQAAVRPLNVSTPTSGRGVMGSVVPSGQPGASQESNQAAGKGSAFVTVPSTNASTIESHNHTITAGGHNHSHEGHSHQHLPHAHNLNSSASVKSLVEAMKIMKTEHLKIDDNVKEQASSLRHFIIICSVSVVIATSVLVALIMILFKPNQH